MAQIGQLSLSQRLQLMVSGEKMPAAAMPVSTPVVPLKASVQVPVPTSNPAAAPVGVAANAKLSLSQRLQLMVSGDKRPIPALAPAPTPVPTPVSTPLASAAVPASSPLAAEKRVPERTNSRQPFVVARTNQQNALVENVYERIRREAKLTSELQKSVSAMPVSVPAPLSVPPVEQALEVFQAKQAEQVELADQADQAGVIGQPDSVDPVSSDALGTLAAKQAAVQPDEILDSALVSVAPASLGLEAAEATEAVSARDAGAIEAFKVNDDLLAARVTELAAPLELPPELESSAINTINTSGAEAAQNPLPMQPTTTTAPVSNANEAQQEPATQSKDKDNLIDSVVPSKPKKLSLSERLQLAAAASAADESNIAPTDADRYDVEDISLDGNEAAADAPVAGVSSVSSVGSVKKMTLTERLLAAASTSGSDAFDSSSTYSSYSSSESDESASKAEVEMEEIEGTLSTLKVFNGWAVGTLWTSEREEIRVTGESIASLQEGLEYSFKGKTVTHAIHGEGFAVTSSMPMISPNDKAIEKYLASSFTGIGVIKAEKYVKETRETGGDEAVEVLRLKLLNEPWSLDLTKIAAKAVFAEGEDPQAAMKHLMVMRNLLLRLGAVKGVRENTLKALSEHLTYVFQKSQATVADPLATTSSDVAATVVTAVDDGQVESSAATTAITVATTAAKPVMPVLSAADVVMGTWALLMRNPYAPIGKVEGYGFGTAETVAGIAQIPRDSPLRLAALVDYAVEQGCQRRGHCFLQQGDFLEAIQRVDPTAPAQQALIHAIKEGLVVVDNRRVYTTKLLQAEKSIASHLVALMQPSEPLTARTAADVEKRLKKNPEKISPTFANGFDADQISAVAGIMVSKQRLHVLSGGPGTGKTAIMETLLSLLLTKKFAFCAPTGMAAKVLTSRVSKHGYFASTVHSLLKGSEDDGFNVNEEDPIDCDVLVVDESTMNGVVMADALLRALPPHAHLIVLGDPGLPEAEGNPDSARAGQLPSISPGRFMQDLLLLPNIHHAHLTKTYRNSGGILEVVKEISEGALKTVDRPSVKFSHGLPGASTGFPAVMQEYLGRVATDGIKNTFLIMPIRKGDRDTPGWNTTFANHVLRQTCNPHGERLPGSTLHLGDRIVIRENMEIAQPKQSNMGAVRMAPSATGVDKEEKSSLIDWDLLAKSMAVKGYGPKDDSSSDRDNSFVDDDSDESEPVKKRVVNGDKGTIVAYAMPSSQARLGSPQWIRLALDDGQVVEFPGSDMSSLEHAYAGTVHGAQGSEFKHVIAVVTPGHPDFMNQNMLFTGLSRAQTSLSVHGDDRVIKRIAATPMPARNSAIVERVKMRLQEIDAEAKKDDETETRVVAEIEDVDA